MLRFKLGLLCVSVVYLALILSRCGGASGNHRQGLINHVVIIFQENRTPDNLFQGLCTFNGSPGCDPTGTNPAQYDIASNGLAAGQTVPLTANSLVTTYDLGHSHDAFLDICDYQSSTNSCAMDGAYLVPCSGPGCPSSCPQNPSIPSCPQYQFVNPSEVQPYLTMAETYTFGDRMFQTNEGPSFPAHQYILSGTSAVCVPGGNCPSGITSTISIAENPGGDERADGTEWAGCLAPPGAYVYDIDTSQPDPTYPMQIVTNALCLEHPTLTDLLDTAGLSWKYYAPTAGSIWTAPDAIQHMCVPSPPYPSETSECTGSDWTNSVVLEGSGAQILTDIANCNLANVSWIIPTGANSDHAGNTTDNGPSWVASIVNQIGQNPVCPAGTANAGQKLWDNTAIIVTWDDWGGWYDHVPPAIRDSYEYGLRVPLIVISPYAKPAYISHVNHDFGSILKFVETVFGLGEIDPAVGYADSRADDLSDCFNFSQTPLVFTSVPAALKTDHFLNDKTPPTPPDND